MSDNDTTHMSGGLSLNSDQTDIDGDVTGRDKIVSAGGDFVQGNQTTISTGGGTYFANAAITQGGQIVGGDYYASNVLPNAEIAQVFKAIYRQITQRPGTQFEDQADLKAEVEEVEIEIVKGETADLSFVNRRLRNLKRMAPDILEVLVNLLSNPALGLPAALRAVLIKANGEAGNI